MERKENNEEFPENENDKSSSYPCAPHIRYDYDMCPHRRFPHVDFRYGWQLVAAAMQGPKQPETPRCTQTGWLALRFAADPRSSPTHLRPVVRERAQPRGRLAVETMAIGVDAQGPFIRR